jgi:hypothetical protein
MLTKQQITEAFVNANLVENYNFLEEDLIKLANAFVEKAKPIFAKDELANCVEVVNSLNPIVGNKLLQVRMNAITEMSKTK